MKTPAIPAQKVSSASTGIQSASPTTRGRIRLRYGLMPRISRASSSSRILRAPISAVIVEPSVPATIAAVSSGPSSRRKATGAAPEMRSIAPKEDASEPPWIPIVEKPTTKATIVAGSSVVRKANTYWRMNSVRQDRPGVTSWPKTLPPSAAQPPAFMIHEPGGTSSLVKARLMLDNIGAPH